MGLGKVLGLTKSKSLPALAKEGAGNLWNDATGKTASRNAARAQMSAVDKATALQREMYEKNLALNEPWRQSGLNALNQLSGQLSAGAFDVQDQPGPGEFVDDIQMPGEFVPEEFRLETDPGYEFRKREAEKQIAHSAATRGGLFSGSTLSALSDRIGNMASEEVGNAYGRHVDKRNFGYGQYQDKMGQANINRGFKYGVYSDKVGQSNLINANRRANMQDRFSRLATLAGFGESATSRSGQAAGMYGQQAGDNAVDRGNAQAAGIVGGYNNQRDFIMGLADLSAKLYGAKTGAK